MTSSSRSDGLPLTDEEAILISELIVGGVPFMVVGVGAAVLQGANAVTADVDLWFKSTSHPGVIEAAKKAGGIFAWRASPPTFSGKGLEDIDVVSRLDGLGSFDEEYAAAVEVPFIGDLTVKVLPLERVIASKRAAGRRKDKVALPALEAAAAAIDAEKKKKK